MTSDNDKESLARLMKLAGERPEVPLSVESRVYHRVQEEWRKASVEPDGDKVYEEVRKSWRRGALRAAILRWTLPIGVAASAIIAVSVMSGPDVVPLHTAATVTRVLSTGELRNQLPEGAAVHAGDIITTGANEGVSLLLARSESLRIDAGTQVRIDSPEHFTLLAGRVYADTGQFVYRNGGLKIDTAFGVVTDVGTQFSVAASDDALVVAVREGRVDVKNQSESHVARVGERLNMKRGGGAELDSLDTHDPYWDWVTELTPTFDMSHKTLLDFLKWAARETGRELQFDSDETRMFAMRTDVYGSVDGLTPDEALEAILATTTVHYRIEADRITIEF